MSDDKDPAVGTCGDCGAEIRSSSRAYSSVIVGREVVRGRIGEPSSEISGVTRGRRIFRCYECLVSEGPLSYGF